MSNDVVLTILIDSLQPKGDGRFVAFDHVTFWVGNAKQVCS